MKFTPKSLPALLASGLDWTVHSCSGAIEMRPLKCLAKHCKQEASNNPHTEFVFAWINRYIQILPQWSRKRSHIAGASILVMGVAYLILLNYVTIIPP